MPDVVWDGSDLIWDGAPLTWATGGFPAPACPDDLFGTSAPKMLGFLPSFWECSTYMRSVLQAEGYDFDIIREYLEAIPTLPLAVSMPDWSIPLWEHSLGIDYASSWSDAERLALVTATLGKVQTGAEIAAYTAALLRVDLADVTVTLSGSDLEIDVDDTLNSEQELLSTRLELITPVHMSLALTTA